MFNSLTHVLLCCCRQEAYLKEKEEADKERAKEDAFVTGDFFHEEVRSCRHLQAVKVNFFPTLRHTLQRFWPSSLF